MRATRRTFRTAAIATAAAAVLAVPAHSAFADSPTAPGTGQEQVLPGNDTKPGDETKPGDQTKPPTDETKPGDKDRQRTSEPQGRQFVKSVKLPDGWSAKVYKEAGKGFDADLFKNGSLQAKLVPGANNVMGWTFTLTGSGDVTAKNNEGGKPDKPKPDTNERKLVREYKNLGGSGFDAKVFKVKGGYDAEMWGKDPASGKYIKWDTLKQRGNKAAHGQHNGAHFVLNPDGTMKGWTEGGSKKDEKKTTEQKNNQGKVVPKGGVKAGTENAASGEDTALLAAGGGMAAAGAAGLGFMLLRRRSGNEG
ncbi:hypothetical protein H9Y04_17555 [Streptomyces sp. TRM66268-LWL]|uniref:Gram-positive cocci surface proteins LPxTG domain-containing protein n=1 Tax=Streptomyces polyasparticus TaxID=2767826 RepID=A0ABR7SJ61_9ACTN|nr:hypothetical protein [Streptomyces polyasparticus]MBC9714368.1 hypothetical protein [Streptomyces polyasparticus]